VSCRHCREDAKFVGYRACRPICLFGKIVYERAYYHCRHCRSGWFPTDTEFEIEEHQSLGAREVISLLVVCQRIILGRMRGVAPPLNHEFATV